MREDGILVKINVDLFLDSPFVSKHRSSHSKCLNPALTEDKRVVNMPGELKKY